MTSSADVRRSSSIDRTRPYDSWRNPARRAARSRSAKSKDDTELSTELSFRTSSGSLTVPTAYRRSPRPSSKVSCVGCGEETGIPTTAASIMFFLIVGRSANCVPMLPLQEPKFSSNAVGGVSENMADPSCNFWRAAHPYAMAVCLIVIRVSHCYDLRVARDRQSHPMVHRSRRLLSKNTSMRSAPARAEPMQRTRISSRS